MSGVSKQMAHVVSWVSAAEGCAAEDAPELLLLAPKVALSCLKWQVVPRAQYPRIHHLQSTCAGGRRRGVSRDIFEVAGVDALGAWWV